MLCDSLNHSGYCWSCWPPRKKRRRRTCNKLADLRVSRDIIRSNSPGYRLCFTLRNRRDYFVLFLSCFFFVLSVDSFFVLFVFYFIFYILRRSGESRGCASFLFLFPNFVIFYLWTNEANYGLDRQSRHQVLPCVSSTFWCSIATVLVAASSMTQSTCRTRGGGAAEPERLSFEKWSGESLGADCVKKAAVTNSGHSAADVPMGA